MNIDRNKQYVKVENLGSFVFTLEYLERILTECGIGYFTTDTTNNTITPTQLTGINQIKIISGEDLEVGQAVINLGK